MRITRYYKKKPLHILIDCGSTNNFLDIQVAKKYGCKIEEREPLSVAVADGSKLTISFMVKGFTWSIQQTTFTSDMLLVPLGCCDLVLGIEWLVTLGDITWNFSKLIMDFKVHGKRHVLRGSPSTVLRLLRNNNSTRPWVMVFMFPCYNFVRRKEDYYSL
uniref:RVP_2 domain-containing protein n=1 Tax=Cajanus cajan TaxID=3821 RepID=A0A151T107_CAJCA|nr:hypothetical protein KK1_023131 [Cajanus cajan]